MEGEFQSGKLTGLGRITRKDGKILEGQFKDHKLHGQGKTISRDGVVKEGRFQDNLLHGVGRVQTPNGTVLEGEFRKGKLQGSGRKLPAGTKFDTDDFDANRRLDSEGLQSDGDYWQASPEKLGGKGRLAVPEHGSGHSTGRLRGFSSKPSPRGTGQKHFNGNFII